jgi:AhpC/TSA family protein
MLDAEVMGISSDSVESHRSFAGKHDLPFALLSDEGGRVRKIYGANLWSLQHVPSLSRLGDPSSRRGRGGHAYLLLSTWRKAACGGSS